LNLDYNGRGDVTSGIPQVRVLVPLLFSIHIN